MPFFGDDRERIISEKIDYVIKIRKVLNLLDTWEQDCDQRLIPFFDQIREILIEEGERV